MSNYVVKEMNSILKLLCLLLVLVAASCNESPDSGKEHSTHDATIPAQEEEVKATLVKMWDAIENEDIERYASFIHPEFTQFGETEPTLRKGKEAEVAGVKDWIESSSDIHTEMEEPIVVIKGSVAWIVYYWKDHGTTNGEAFASRGKSTRIFVKENGKWLCIHGHYTLLP